MGDKSGDQQARAELLGELLLSIDETPYVLRHGTGRSSYYLIMLTVGDEELAALSRTRNTPPTVIEMGSRKFLPLQLEESLKMGQIEDRLYDPTEKRWTATIALMRYK